MPDSSYPTPMKHRAAARALVALAASAAALLATHVPGALAQSKIYVVEPFGGFQKRGALWEVDATGQRKVLSNFGLDFQGPRGRLPRRVAVRPNGTILVVDQQAGSGGRGALFKVDPDTGARSILSDFGKKAQGPLDKRPFDVMVGQDGEILVLTQGGRGGNGSIWSIDPRTGVRTSFSDFRNAAQGAPIRGYIGTGLALSPDGDVIVLDDAGGSPCFRKVVGCGAVVRVDSNGFRTPITDFGDPTQGPLYDYTRGITVEPDGRIVVGVEDNEETPIVEWGLVRVDPATGGRGATFAPGTVSQSTDLDVIPFDGTLLVVSGVHGQQGVWAVDPATGVRTQFSDFNDLAQGPTGGIPGDVDSSGAPNYDLTGIAFVPFHPLPGDAVVVDYQAGTGNRGALFVVRPDTGERVLWSDFGDATRGDLGSDPFGVTRDPAGWFWVIDQRAGFPCTGFPGVGCGGLFKVNPLTGVRKVASDFGIGAQGALGARLYGITAESDGKLLVVDQDAGPTADGALFRVDPRSGSRSVVVDFSGIGGNPSDVAVAPNGDILVVDPVAAPFPTPILFSIDPATHVPTPFSRFLDAGQGEQAVVPIAVEADPARGILVLDQLGGGGAFGYGTLLGVADDGTRTLLNDFSTDTEGPLGFNVGDVHVNALGDILVQDFDAGTDARGALFSIDQSGNRTVLSDFGDAGQGPLGQEPSGFVLVPPDDTFPPPPSDTHDLAVTDIAPPAAVTLSVASPVQVKTVKVQIQNRSPHVETVPDAATLEALVELTATSLGACPDPTVALAPPTKLPIVLKPKQKVSVGFDVTFDCANDPAKSTKADPGHEDFSFAARVDHQALGDPDVHPDDDVCPRSVAAPFVFDLFPDLSIKDKGCGEKKPDKTLGDPVVVDVVVK